MWVFLVEIWNFELFQYADYIFFHTYVNIVIMWHSLSWEGYKLSSRSSNSRKEPLSLTKPV